MNAPEDINDSFMKAGLSESFAKEKSKFTLLFIRDKKEFDERIQNVISHIEDDSLFWIAYPKGTSKLNTDVNRDILWADLRSYGVRPVSMIAVDDNWSAMRIRPIKNKQ